jgi:hypothetical protein
MTICNWSRYVVVTVVVQCSVRSIVDARSVPNLVMTPSWGDPCRSADKTYTPSQPRHSSIHLAQLVAYPASLPLRDIGGAIEEKRG